MRTSASVACLALLASASFSIPARGDTPLFSARYGRIFSSSFTRGHVDGAEVPLLSAVVRTERRAERGGLVVPITEHFAVARGPRAEMDALSASLGRSNLRWAPPRRLLMDQVAESVRGASARRSYGVDGAGAVIGVVDSGIDVAHSSVRHADGSTRIRWLLAFGEEPRGVHADLEDEYGCTEFDDCAVYDQADIDAALDSGIVAGLPSDVLGHGTHVTSIAAGSDESYPGIAPGADLVLVRATGDAGTATDSALLLGTRFVFDRAAELGLPAVVNLSLGSGFGAHDGSSALEQALDELAEGEGRAIVLASGNDGSLYLDLSPDYPDPVGLHAEVRVPEDGEVRVPLLTLPTGDRRATGSIFVWISTAPGDEVDVAFANGRGKQTVFVPAGEEGGFSSSALDADDELDDYEGIIANGVDDALEVGVGPRSAVVGMAGSWEDGENFEIVLRGHATARLWVQSSGDVGPETNGLGVVFPRARSVGTVSIPATASHVIAVGASVNRNEWTDYSGELIEMEIGVVGSRASFSGAGPSQVGAMKPDLIAPGGQVVAAMSILADPRVFPETSQFASRGSCPDPDVECFVVDDEHAVAMGTSMAAPIVTGAVALALARDPTLELTDLRRLLRASTKAPLLAEDDLGRSGAGVLDVEQFLLAQDVAERGEPGEPDAERSRLVFGAPFLHPVPEMELEGVVLLRDADGAPVLVPEDELELEVDGPGEGHITKVSAGLVEFVLAAEAGSAERELTVTLTRGGERLARGELPIFADAGNSRGGIELTGGTCAQAAPRSRASSPGVGLVALSLLVLGGLRRFAGGAQRVES